jgi:acyl-CoA thioesterase I
MKSKYSLFLALFLFLFLQCTHEPFEKEVIIPPIVTQIKEKIDILALGDSYTKGQGVLTEMNFPNQLTDSLRKDSYEIIGTRIIAQTGWRTDNLLNAIENAADLKDSTFSLVTLLIGVNNQFQNASFATYKTEFQELLSIAIQRAGNDKNRVLVVSIPDYAFTPYGQGANPTNISNKIDQYNAANKSITESNGVRYVDITPISREGVANPDLVASDGLHPSEKQYTAWVSLMLPIIKDMLQ